MSKQKKIQFLSLEFKNETGEKHTANFKANGKNIKHAKLISPCECGDKICVDGILYRCMPDPSGQCVWWETSEVCE
ncbi:hypothetical protein OC25_24835 [Pedobacter kyungheensis]|uniref:Uncharacterized protein n=1 Tax=Pedobacter kyungheensis TaxID=1069985 RepID=A0A0C1D0R0_9SPHI|nr:hypothetical protein [Pedobacter kyungheensis]KIA90281.1 hypothetical protein OC25_24835 [Pedobacter kyungheensis]